MNKRLVSVISCVFLLAGLLLQSGYSTAATAPGTSLAIASVPNLRDLGGYKTSDGKTVATGLVYRSNQLSNISPDDMKKLARLKLKNAYDLRTTEEREKGRRSCRTA